MIKHKQSGAFVIEVNMSNPNGDTEANEPRTTDLGYGYITDVCMKRRGFRDILSDHSTVEFEEIQAQMGFDAERFHIFESEFRGYENEVTGSDPEKRKKSKEKAAALAAKDPEAFLNRYADVRLFGTTALEQKAKDSMKFIKTGGLQIRQPVSIVPISITSEGIVRAYGLDKESIEKGTAMFGNKTFVKHAVYYGWYSSFPGILNKSLASNEDIEVFKRLLPLAFSLSPSAARPDVRVIAAYNIRHEASSIGTAYAEREFLAAAKPTLKEGVHPNDASSIDDYNIPSYDEVLAVTENYNVELQDLIAEQHVTV